MSENLQEREFNVFGLTKAMRQGILVTILSIQFLAIGYLYITSSTREAKLTDRLLDVIIPARDKMNESSDKVNAMVDSIQVNNNSHEKANH